MIGETRTKGLFLSNLFQFLGIEEREWADLDDNELIGLIVKTVEQRRKDRERSREKTEIDALIDEASLPGPGELASKLHPYERAWARGVAREDFEAFKAFIKFRPKLRVLLEEAPGAWRKKRQSDNMRTFSNGSLGLPCRPHSKYDQ